MIKVFSIEYNIENDKMKRCYITDSPSRSLAEEKTRMLESPKKIFVKKIQKVYG